MLTWIRQYFFVSFLANSASTWKTTVFAAIKLIGWKLITHIATLKDRHYCAIKNSVCPIGFKLDNSNISQTERFTRRCEFGQNQDSHRQKQSWLKPRYPAWTLHLSSQLEKLVIVSPDPPIYTIINVPIMYQETVHCSPVEFKFYWIRKDRTWGVWRWFNWKIMINP